MNIKLLPLFALFILSNSQAQTTLLEENYSKEEYSIFVEQEKNQTVIEGQDALFTVLLSKAQDSDILIDYIVTGKTASLKNNITVPEVKSFRIPAGEIQSTMHIPTIDDGISELDEEFTIEITKGININTNKVLNNKKLTRTRTITDRKLETSLISFYHENGVVKCTPSATKIEVRNVNGILIDNKNLSKGIYFISAIVNGNTISKSIAIK